MLETHGACRVMKLKRKRYKLCIHNAYTIVNNQEKSNKNQKNRRYGGFFILNLR